MSTKKKKAVSNNAFDLKLTEYEQECLRSFQETRERMRSTATTDPIQDNDDNDRSTYMLVMVIGWVIYFFVGLIVGLAI